MNKSFPLLACAVDDGQSTKILIDKLVLDGQQILAIPSSLHTIQECNVTFLDVVLPILEEVIGSIDMIQNFEDDWAMMLHIDSDAV